LNYISKLHLAMNLVGVDNDASALGVAARTTAAIKFHKSLDAATGGQGEYDIAMCIHTLHHIAPREQVSALNAIAQTVRPSGLLYIFEDSWSRLKSSPALYRSALSQRFLGLSTNAVRRLYSANDHWSNAWCYGRRLPIAARAYQPLERWIALLPSYFEVLDCGIEGFNPDRLHGVPSGWVVARRVA
jgi:SAM-dependent methyltransferase